MYKSGRLGRIQKTSRNAEFERNAGSGIYRKSKLAFVERGVESISLSPFDYTVLHIAESFTPFTPTLQTGLRKNVPRH